MRFAVRTSIFLLVVGLGGVSANAAIVVQNGSFESPDKDPYALVTPTGWTWNGLGGRGVVDEGVAGFPLSTEGTQWAFLSGESAIAQNVGLGMVQPNFAYVYSFSQFEQTNIGDNGSGIRIEIWSDDPFAGGTLLDFDSYSATGAGTMIQRAGVLQAGPAAVAGTSLYLVLRAIADADNPVLGVYNVGIDDVVLAGNEAPASIVPEPASFAMWGLGALSCGLLRYRRRPSTARPVPGRRA